MNGEEIIFWGISILCVLALIYDYYIANKVYKLFKKLKDE